jgi:hypothetical protein
VGPVAIEMVIFCCAAAGSAAAAQAMSASKSLRMFLSLK